MRAERHGGARPEGGRFRQARGGLDVAEPAERRVHVRDEVLDGLQREIVCPPAFHAAETIHPAAGLSQRYANQIAPALTRTASQGDERSEGGEISRAVVHDLSGQVLRPIGADGEPVFVRHPADGLDDGLEPSSLAPWAGVAEGGEGHAYDAWAQLCQLLGGEAETGKRSRTIGLAEDVGAPDEAAKRLAGRGLTQIEG